MRIGKVFSLTTAIAITFAICMFLLVLVSGRYGKWTLRPPDYTPSKSPLAISIAMDSSSCCSAICEDYEIKIFEDGVVYYRADCEKFNMVGACGSRISRTDSKFVTNFVLNAKALGFFELTSQSYIVGGETKKVWIKSGDAVNNISFSAVDVPKEFMALSKIVDDLISEIDASRWTEQCSFSNLKFCILGTVL